MTGQAGATVQIADCYIHIHYRSLRRDEFDKFSEELQRVAVNLATNVVKRGQEVEFTFEEGTLLQRILVWGSLALGAIDFASHYHDLRESIADATHDEKTFSDWAIGEFHKITHSVAANEIYRRTSSRDLNRLRRIVSNFDKVSNSRLSSHHLRRIRDDVVHDLAGLARANPHDPEVDQVLRALPSHEIPDLPKSVDEAIDMDRHLSRHRKPMHDDEVEKDRPHHHHRRVHANIILPKKH
jgi:hypothetical protein